jgi:hypothetical protein
MRWIAPLIVALALLAPRASEACAVCLGGQNPETQRAFLIGTLILSSMPFVLVGGIGFVLWRRMRRSEAADAASARSAG